MAKIVNMAQHFRWGALLRFTAPSIAMMVFTSIYGIVDGLFVSNFAGKTAFAAVNLIMPFIMILSTAGFMVGTGGSAVVAKTRGEGDEPRARRYFSLLVYFAFALGVVLGLLGLAFMEPVAALLGADQAMMGDCVLYGRMLMATLPFYVLQYALQSFFVTAGKPQLGFVVVLIAGVANMALDALFVGVLGWGVAGAAAATNISELLGGGLPLIYFLRRNSSFLRLGPTRLEWRIIGKTCVNGSSEMVSNIAMSVVSMFYNLQLMAYAGQDGVAAYGVIMYAALVFAAIFIGYAMGSSPLMSYQYGARNKREMRNLLKKSLVFVAVGGLAMFGAAQALAQPIAAVFVGYDPALEAMTVEGFRLYALAFLLMGYSIYGSALFTSLNNGVVSAIISFLRTLVFEVGSVLLLPLWLGLAGIWLSVSVAELASVTVTTTFLLALGRHYGYLGKLPEGGHDGRPRGDSD